jgi:hypothetical protein
MMLAIVVTVTALLVGADLLDLPKRVRGTRTTF